MHDELKKWRVAKLWQNTNDPRIAPPEPATVFRVEAPDGAAIEVRRPGNPQGPCLAQLDDALWRRP